ncbi:hypothetical protein ASZ90_006379 [hydrocarbon metagenome]|uniref:Uncharacterized protein n=1 Tax=hydrocarbon metagenome TaxID=938273 RepID=A0A0W8FSE1_9ZZZZ
MGVMAKTILERFIFFYCAITRFLYKIKAPLRNQRGFMF